MFDLTSSKLLILAVVALVVVGPKELPALLRTVGKYMGMIKRQANEFRAQFEEAMRETELADLKKEVEDLGREAQSTMHEATQTIESHVGEVNREVNAALADVDAQAAQPVPLAEDHHAAPATVEAAPLPPLIAPPIAAPVKVREPVHTASAESDASRSSGA
ncbi:MAG: twin-arginine translocase subunit TatB [Proteobacteria bacterium]|nr:twin-arginine translocase subunit TatB [Pseudomonadota bacterium]